MAVDQSMWSFFADASLVVKLVMFLLLCASMVSWTFIIQRALFLKATRLAIEHFESRFWSGSDLQQLYHRAEHSHTVRALEAIFYAGFKEFLRLRHQSGLPQATVMEGVQRAMRIARSREVDRLESHLSFLATVGSTSPYVGLFGTVWGIMTSFRALGQATSSTISMVAPGISEALIATAMGLFAAIPAVIAYNRYASQVERLINQYITFEEEFYSILVRQLQAKPVIRDTEALHAN